MHYLKKAERVKSKILFVSTDEKVLEIVKNYDRALKLDVDFKRSIAEEIPQNRYEFAFIDVELVSSKSLHLLNICVRQKIFIFDFDPMRATEEVVLSEKTKTIPHRLFLPQKMLEMLGGHQSVIGESTQEAGSVKEPAVDEGLSVLIVEDDASNRILFQAYLANQKTWKVDYAHNGFSALKDYLETKKYDVMVTDLQMPEMDGFTLLSKIENPHKPARIIILSADSTEETALRAKQFNVDQFITKPVRKKEFIDAIQG